MNDSRINSSVKDSRQQEELNGILAEYQVVFWTATGLPPTRKIRHATNLVIGFLYAVLNKISNLGKKRSKISSS